MDTPVVSLTYPEPHVALVTITRPDARNAVSAAVAGGLDAAVKTIEGDNNIRVAILTGAGEQAFCAGADLKETAAGGLERLFTPDGGFAGFVSASRRKAWIAAVNGFALGGGAELALACDLIVAVPQAAFGLPEVRRGLIAAAGGLFRLPRAVPYAIALELIATGRQISAEEAHRWGLVNRLAPKSELMVATLDMARAIAANAPLAVQESLAIARITAGLADDVLWRLSGDALRRIAQTEDFPEGSRAFVEKRPPKWTGRSATAGASDPRGAP